MWKGLKKALGSRSKGRSGGRPGTASADVSQHSTASSALFPLDLADVDALSAWAHEQGVGHDGLPLLGQPGAGARPHGIASGHGSGQPQGDIQAPQRSWGQLMAQLQTQHTIQQLASTGDDSVSKRRAAAVQKRTANALDPTACAYQMRSLLALSTAFEHQLQRDTMAALRQVPGSVAAQAAAAAAAASECPLANCSADGTRAAPGWCCWGSEECSCSAGGPSRTPSATAASTAHVALQLARAGYRVIVRKVLHSKAYWTKAMDNTFIVALDTSSGGHVEYVVDPHFRDTFNVGVMSANYRSVWATLPAVFVGLPCQLQPVVQLLCGEIELSFLEAGRPVPPWRGWAATINRWMSDQYVDLLLPHPGAGDDEVAAFVARCTHFTGATPVPGAGPPSASSGGASSSGASGSTCSPCAGAAGPGGAPGQRLADAAKLHVSSVLSSVSGSSKRQVPEPQHKQLGFAAASCARGGGPAGSASGAAAAAVALCAPRRPPPPPPDEAASEDEAGSISGAAVVPAALLQAGTCRQAGPRAISGASSSSGSVSSRGGGAASASEGSAGSSPPSSPGGCVQLVGRSSSSSGGGPGALRRRSGGRSLLTAQIELKQQLAQQNERLQLVLGGQACFAGTQLPGGLQQLQAAQQQQQQQASALHAQPQLAQLQLQMQQAQLQMMQQQQLLHARQLAQPHAQQPQQVQQLPAGPQQLPAGLQQLPRVHTVRPAGIAPAAPAAAPAGLAAQLQALHPSMHAGAQEQPRLLRLIRPAAANQ